MKAGTTALMLILFLGAAAAGGLHLGGERMDATVLNPGFYERLVQEVEIGVHGQQYVQGEVETAVRRAGLPAHPVLMEPVRRAVERAFPKEWFEQQAVLAARDVLLAARGAQEAPSLVIDLTDKRRNLEAELVNEISDAAAEIISLLGISPRLFGAVGERLAAEVAGQFPSEVAVAELIQEEAVLQDAVRGLEQAHALSQLAAFAPYVLAGSLACMLLLAGPAAGIRWFGLSLLLAGAGFWGLVTWGDALGAQWVMGGPVPHSQLWLELTALALAQPSPLVPWYVGGGGVLAAAGFYLARP